MWGTIAVGIFGGGALLSQIIGTVSISIFAFVCSFIIFTVVKMVFGLRVSEDQRTAVLSPDRDLAAHALSTEGPP